MSAPPPYEESPRTSLTYLEASDKQKSPKPANQWNIVEKVRHSRNQLIYNLVEHLWVVLQDRAQRGISATTLALVPYNDRSGVSSATGEIVGFADSETPMMLHLEGRTNASEFWSQPQAVAELEAQLRDRLRKSPMCESVPFSVSLPERPVEQVRKRSIFGRRPLKTEAVDVLVRHSEPTVTVNVHLDNLHIRKENDFGLYETMPLQVVLVKVVTR
ncbi:hypothetical protein LTR66_002770 [Elasticomyces elasticus]|nr:hypothetical protein LTR50_002547 [Elasticomyces elasticus]KAK4997910.1 hypothetical protein LTR66_002770 [Elasticomyces elasticus]KAK5011595.1 hypothetical protein LTR28_012297 [Elasticomyces elasticus]